jgi:3-oxoacyl-[acyl-carrier-protein] synthase-3
MAFYGNCADHRAPGISLIEGGSGAPLVNATGVPHFTHDVESVRTHGLELLRAGLRAAIQAGVAPDSVDWWIPHPANGHMAQYTATSLGLPADKVVCEAGVLGNLGSADLKYCSWTSRRQRSMPRPGRCFGTSSTGAGLPPPPWS